MESSESSKCAPHVSTEDTEVKTSPMFENCKIEMQSTSPQQTSCNPDEEHRQSPQTIISNSDVSLHVGCLKPKVENLSSNYEDLQTSENILKTNTTEQQKLEEFQSKQEEFQSKQENFKSKQEEFQPKQENFLSKQEEFQQKQQDFQLKEAEHQSLHENFPSKEVFQSKQDLQSLQDDLESIQDDLQSVQKDLQTRQENNDVKVLGADRIILNPEIVISDQNCEVKPRQDLYRPIDYEGAFKLADELNKLIFALEQMQIPKSEDECSSTDDVESFQDPIVPRDTPCDITCDTPCDDEINYENSAEEILEESQEIYLPKEDHFIPELIAIKEETEDNPPSDQLLLESEDSFNVTSNIEITNNQFTNLDVTAGLDTTEHLDSTKDIKLQESCSKNITELDTTEHLDSTKDIKLYESCSKNITDLDTTEHLDDTKDILLLKSGSELKNAAIEPNSKLECNVNREFSQGRGMEPNRLEGSPDINIKPTKTEMNTTKSIEDENSETNLDNDDSKAANLIEKDKSGETYKISIVEEKECEEEYKNDARSKKEEKTKEESPKEEEMILRPNPIKNLNLLLKLQKNMAVLQMQLSNLQDSIRTTNVVVQELMDNAFGGM